MWLPGVCVKGGKSILGCEKSSPRAYFFSSRNWTNGKKCHQAWTHWTSPSARGRATFVRWSAKWKNVPGKAWTDGTNGCVPTITFFLLMQNGKIFLGKLGPKEQVEVIYSSHLSHWQLCASLGKGRASGGCGARLHRFLAFWARIAFVWEIM